MSQQITTGKIQGPALDKTDEVPLGDKQLVDQEAIPTVDYRNPASEGEDDISNDIPWKYKWIGLAVVMALPLGRNWADAGLGPLRNTLRNELGINNEQFGVLSSAEAVINCIWPFFGGIVLDWVGVETVSPACTSIILFGSLITAGGIRSRNWQVVAGGFILRGFGTALLDSCQQVFFHALGGRRGLAFAFGLENAIAEAISLASEAAAVPIYQAHGLDVVFWIPVAFCAVSVIINFVYIWYAKKVIPAQYRPSSGRDRAKSDNASVKVISFASVWLLPWCFWMLPMTQLLQSGAASGFSVARADIIRLRGYKETTAGFLTSGATVIQVLLSPIVGYSIDRWGHRFHYVALAPILWVTAAGLLGFSSVHPLVALVFASLAGSINGAPLQMAMHLLVADHRLIGTAFGVWRAFNNSGSVIMEVSFGRMLDASPFRDTVKQYSNVLFLKIGLKSWAFCLGLLYILVDLRYLGGGLTMTRAKRDKIESTISAEEKEFHPITRRSPVKWVTIMSMCTMAAMCITGWTLFFMGLAS